MLSPNSTPPDSSKRSSSEVFQNADQNFAECEVDKLRPTNDAWRKKIKMRTFRNPKNIILLGPKQCGKTTTLNSICRALYPERPMNITHPDTRHVFLQLAPQLSIWELPSFDSSENAMKNTIRVVKGEMKGIPPMDLVIVILTPENLQQAEFLSSITSLQNSTNGQASKLPFLFYVNKLDTIPAHDLPTLFEGFSQRLGVRRELLLPFKNPTGTERGASFSLIDYFVLRVLDKTFTCLEYYDRLNPTITNP